MLTSLLKFLPPFPVVAIRKSKWEYSGQLDNGELSISQYFLYDVYSRSRAVQGAVQGVRPYI
jgi:hypothetical protein